MLVHFQQKTAVRSELYALLEPEFDGLYDLLLQIFGEEQTSLALLQKILQRAMRYYRSEKYERYLRLWIFSLCARAIQKHYPRYLAELPSTESTRYPYLSLEEKLVLMFHDRAHFRYEEIAACLRISVGRVGRLLTYAREKLARNELGLDWNRSEVELQACQLNSLLTRVAINEKIDENTLAPHCATCASYSALIRQSQNIVAALPRHSYSEISSKVRADRFLPIFSKQEGFHLSLLSWRWKLGLELSVLGAIASLMVFVAPWFLNHFNTRALLAGNIRGIFQSPHFQHKEPELPVIDTERLLASTDLAEQEMQSKPADKDEFAEVDFPSGDSYESGAAPIAPSRQSAAVFRLIVQSSSPKELIPEVKKLFAGENVRERESSGRVMPGGVYFDGITSVGVYPKILEQIEKLGITKTYSNPASGRNPGERARLIVWIQQI